VCGWSETDDDDPSIGITESRDRLAPILIVSERGSLGEGDFLPPFHESGTSPALDESRFEVAQRGGRFSVE
jgi:hypothetical protein